MTLEKANKINGVVICDEYTCDSTDIKPIEGVPILSILLENDTGYVYYYAGDGNWIKL